MFTRTHSWIPAITLVSMAAVAASRAGDLAIDWRSMNGGGAMRMSAGDLTLSCTIGQSDANNFVMTGGEFELTAGFWAVPPCWCPSDLNNDGRRDALDAQRFVDCMVPHGLDCACADLLTDGALDMNDVTAFVTDLLTGQTCP